MRIFKKSVYFLFESGSLDSPGGPSSNRRYSITGVLRRRVIMNFTSKGPAEAKSTITLRRIHLIRRPYAKRRGRRETMFDCPLSKTVKILDQRSCRISGLGKIRRWSREDLKCWCTVRCDEAVRRFSGSQPLGWWMGRCSRYGMHRGGGMRNVFLPVGWGGIGLPKKPLVRSRQ